MPQVEALGTTYAGKVKITKVETPKNRRLCLDLKVLSLPTFLFYKDGKELDRLSGNVSLEAIEKSINKLL
jgi:thioredoxin 1